MNYTRIIILTLILLISSCSQREIYGPTPAGISLSGSWIYEKHDERSYQRLLDALNHVPLGPMRMKSTEYRSYNPQHNEEKMLRDLLVGLLTVIPKELFIEQSVSEVAIDFGVAGYHTFNIMEKTKIIMDGLEIDAYAGWKDNDLMLRLGMSSYYQLIEKFTLINNDYLIETIELNIPGRDRTLTFKRYFKRARAMP